MNLEKAVFGHKATSRDLYLASLWLGSTALVFLGLILTALNLDATLLVFLILFFTALAFLWLRPGIKAPINGVVFKKFELLMLAVVALAAWIFVSVLWLMSVWSVLITLLLLGAIALILWLPGYAGSGASPEEDERLRKLEAFSSADSFNITFAFTVLLFVMGFFNVVAMDLRQAFIILVLLFIFTKSISMAYYNRRGDVE
jgi:hypothetical protein